MDADCVNAIMVIVGFVIYFLSYNWVQALSEHSENMNLDPNSTLKMNFTDSLNSSTNQLLIYRRLFKQKHAMQIEAVQNIQTFENDKKYRIINIMLEQIMKVNLEAQQNLTNSGFIPGTTFPKDQHTRETISKVIENTAFFSELVLRIPDIVHNLYDPRRDWRAVMAWSTWFCRESNILDDSDLTFLNLMMQEISLISKSENYTNPYSSSNKLPKKDTKVPKNQTPVKSKKKTKKIKKGPRLTSHRSDL